MKTLKQVRESLERMRIELISKTQSEATKDLAFTGLDKNDRECRVAMFYSESGASRMFDLLEPTLEQLLRMNAE